MNWKDIGKKYSKAFNLIRLKYPGNEIVIKEIIEGYYSLCYYVNPYPGHDDILPHLYFINDSMLYSFFDENEIYIGIDIDVYWREDSKNDEPEYSYQIAVVKEGACGSSESSIWFDTRTEAETKAFERAFEILEKKL